MTRGIHTIADLRERCHVDADTGCWHWRGGWSGNGVPSARIPAAPGVSLPLGHVIAVLVTGDLPKPGIVWAWTCETRQCGCPAHRRPMTLSAVRKLRSKGGHRPDAIASICRAARARATVGSMETARAIRASDEPLRVMAARYGMSLAMAGLIRQGKRWAETIPAASVWAWAGGDAGRAGA